MIDLGDGLTRFKAGEAEFGVDLLDWVRWYVEVGSSELAERPHELVELARQRLKEKAGVELNADQADSFLHAVSMAYAEKKRAQELERQTSPSSTASPPFPESTD